MVDTDKVWLITGSSTGWGRALAQAALERGYRVVATARKPEHLQELRNRSPSESRLVPSRTSKCDRY